MMWKGSRSCELAATEGVGEEEDVRRGLGERMEGLRVWV